MKKVYSFLKKIKRNNNREWFNEHKELYLRAKEEVDALASSLIGLVSEIDDSASRFDVKDVTYRIYRDTRFSQDKTPYKTHVGIFINPPFGKKSLRCGYYFHIEPGNSFVCGGNIPLPGPYTRAIRRSIYDNIEEYKEIVDSPEFKTYFESVGTEFLKTAPKGFPKDWEDIDYLKPKDFVVMLRVGDEFYGGKDCLQQLRPILAQIQRFNDFINYSIDEVDDNSHGR